MATMYHLSSDIDDDTALTDAERAAYAEAKSQYEQTGKKWNDLTRLEKLPLYRRAMIAASPIPATGGEKE